MYDDAIGSMISNAMYGEGGMNAGAKKMKKKGMKESPEEKKAGEMADEVMDNVNEAPAPTAPEATAAEWESADGLKHIDGGLDHVLSRAGEMMGRLMVKKMNGDEGAMNEMKGVERAIKAIQRVKERFCKNCKPGEKEKAMEK